MKYHIGQTDKNGQAISIGDRVLTSHNWKGVVKAVIEYEKVAGYDGGYTTEPNWDKCLIIEKEEVKEPHVGGFPDGATES